MVTGHQRGDVASPGRISTEEFAVELVRLIEARGDQRGSERIAASRRRASAPNLSKIGSRGSSTNGSGSRSRDDSWGGHRLMLCSSPSAVGVTVAAAVAAAVAARNVAARNGVGSSSKPIFAPVRPFSTIRLPFGPGSVGFVRGSSE